MLPTVSEESGTPSTRTRPGSQASSRAPAAGSARTSRPSSQLGGARPGEGGSGPAPSPALNALLDTKLEARGPALLPIMCDGCLGRTAYLYCEVCRDSMCSACFAAVHKGRLARHACYPVQQPPGVGPDVEALIPDGGPHSAIAHVSHGEQLLLSIATRAGAAKPAPPVEAPGGEERGEEEEAGEEEEEGAGGGASGRVAAGGGGGGGGGGGSPRPAAAPTPSRPPSQVGLRRLPTPPFAVPAQRGLTAEMQKRRLEKQMGMEAAISADGQDEAVTLEDIARYLARRRRLGQVGPRLQLRAKLQPIGAVLDAATALLTEDKAFEVGGLNILANQKPDPWMASAAFSGNGRTVYN